jgi:hypothetical protein
MWVPRRDAKSEARALAILRRHAAHHVHSHDAPAEVQSSPQPALADPAGTRSRQLVAMIRASSFSATALLSLGCRQSAFADFSA